MSLSRVMSATHTQTMTTYIVVPRPSVGIPTPVFSLTVFDAGMLCMFLVDAETEWDDEAWELGLRGIHAPVILIKYELPTAGRHAPLTGNPAMGGPSDLEHPRKRAPHPCSAAGIGC